MYVTGVANVTAVQLNPEYFRMSALQAGGMDRREFLQRELVNLQAAIYQYQTAAFDLMRKGAELDGVNDVATWLTRIGATVGTVTTAAPLISVISWAVAGIGAVWNNSVKKRDNRKAQELTIQAQKLHIESQQIQEYYTLYNNELKFIRMRPILLGGAIGVIILKRR